LRHNAHLLRRAKPWANPVAGVTLAVARRIRTLATALAGFVSLAALRPSARRLRVRGTRTCS
jgi:hypothetical protein